MDATAEAVRPDPNPYEETLRKLDLQGAQAMYDMVKGALVDGQLPPQELLGWFAMTAAHRVGFFEQALSRLKKPDSIKACQEHLNNAVTETATILAVLGQTKNFVLSEQVVSVLNARKLRLPLDYDATYGRLLP